MEPGLRALPSPANSGLGAVAAPSSEREHDAEMQGFGPIRAEYTVSTVRVGTAHSRHKDPPPLFRHDYPSKTLFVLPRASRLHRWQGRAPVSVVLS